MTIRINIVLKISFFIKTDQANSCVMVCVIFVIVFYTMIVSTTAGPRCSLTPNTVFCGRLSTSGSLYSLRKGSPKTAVLESRYCMIDILHKYPTIQSLIIEDSSTCSCYCTAFSGKITGCDSICPTPNHSHTQSENKEEESLQEGDQNDPIVIALSTVFGIVSTVAITFCILKKVRNRRTNDHGNGSPLQLSPLTSISNSPRTRSSSEVGENEEETEVKSVIASNYNLRSKGPVEERPLCDV